MAEDRFSNLLYGTPGVPRYDKIAKEWHFPRQSLSSPRHVKTLGEAVPIVGPAIHVEASLKKPTSARQQKQRLARRVPPFGPAAFMFKDWDVPSSSHDAEVEGEPAPLKDDPIAEELDFDKLLQGPTLRHDDSTSTLLAIGKIRLPEKSHTSAARRYRPVIAFPSGGSGEVLVMKLITPEQLRWRQDTQLLLHASTAQAGEEGYHSSKVSPIRQIIFGEGSNHSQSRLAVRRDTIVEIFSPRVRSSSTAGTCMPGFRAHLPASRIDARLVHTFDCQEIDGSSFIDVAINPHDPNQVALVTDAGSWSVWLLNPQARYSGRDPDRPRVRGRMHSTGNTVGDGSFAHRDGWGRIAWANDSFTMLVASRHSLRILDINDENALKYADVRSIGLAKRDDRILDLRVDPADRSRFFILTSTRVMWLQVQNAERIESMAASYKVAALVSWLHFRSPHDDTLTLDVMRPDAEKTEPGDEREQSIFALLSSRASDITTVCSFQYDYEKAFASSKYDPFLVPVKSAASVSGDDQLGETSTCGFSSLRLTSIKIDPCSFGSAIFNKNFDRRSRDIEVYKITALMHDLSVFEQTFTSWDSGKIAFERPPDIIKRFPLSKSSVRVPDDSIEVDHTEETTYSNNSANGPLQIAKKENRALDLRAARQRPTDLQWLLNTDTSRLKQPSDRSTSEFQVPFEEYLEGLQEAMQQKAETLSAHVELLSELNQKSTRVIDLASGAEAFEALLQSSGQLMSNRSLSDLELRLDISPVSRILGDLLGLDQLGLEQVYRTLLKSYFEPLPEGTTDRVRVAIERQIRFVTTQICLSSHAVRLRSVESAVAGLASGKYQGESRTFDIALGRRKSQTGLTTPLKSMKSSGTSRESSVGRSNTVNAVQDSNFEELSQLDSSPPLPSQDTGLSTLSSQASTSANTIVPDPLDSVPPKSSNFLAGEEEAEDELEEDPYLQRLRNLTTSLYSQPHLSKPVSNILDHWTLGADPASYDWSATNRRLGLADQSTPPAQETEAADSEDDEDEMDEKALRRKKRRLEKEKRRERRRQVLAKRERGGGADDGGFVQSSQALGSSQPQISASSPPSSQQGPSSPAARRSPSFSPPRSSGLPSSHGRDRDTVGDVGGVQRSSQGSQSTARPFSSSQSTVQPSQPQPESQSQSQARSNVETTTKKRKKPLPPPVKGKRKAGF